MKLELPRLQLYWRDKPAEKKKISVNPEAKEPQISVVEVVIFPILKEIVLYGILINFMLFVIFGITFNFFSWIGYGLAYYFVVEEFSYWFRSLIPGR